MTKISKTLATVGALLAVATTSVAQNSPGSYLALRQAFFHSDDAAVAQFIEQALRENPDDTQMLEQGIVSDVFFGDLDSAHDRVEQLSELEHNNLYTELAELAFLVSNEDYEGAVERAETSEHLGFLSPDILRAWQLADDGKIDDAEKLLADAATNDADGAPLYDYQRALVLANGREYARAAEILAGDEDPLYLSNDSFYTHIATLILADDPSWRGIVEEAYQSEVHWPYHIQKIVDEASKGDAPAMLSFASPLNAIAEHLRFLLGTSTDEARDAYITRFFTTLLPQMAPEHDGLWINTLGYFDRSEEDDDLLLYAQNIDDKSPYRLLRDNYLSDIHYLMDDVDAARKIVDDAPDDNLSALIYKANSYRVFEEFPRAIEYYSQALELAGETPDSTNLLYGLAIAYDRSGDWPTARDALERAVLLSPEDPELLNYLGYSYVDRKEQVDRGLDLISKAVEIAPDRGHILDSLGWAYYRLGRYDEALEPLETASFLIDTEPVVYAHLGDLYWHLGRKNEARHMWERSLVFLNEETVDITTEEINTRLETNTPPQP